MPHEVFISHSSLDKPVADAVCAALENTAIGCWIAPRDVQPGRSFAGEITRAIQSSKVMVLIFSAHSNTSEQILREVQLAANSHLPIVPFRIEDVLPNEDLEYYLSAPQWLDALTPPLESHLQRLGTSLKALLEMAVEDPAKRAMAPVVPSVNSGLERSQQHSVATAQEPTTPVKSAQTTLITTVIRNMFLNWPVLISWLVPAVIIPRLYLAAIIVSPNWAELARKYLLTLHDLQPNWPAWVDSVKQQWDIGLTIALAVGFVLIAIAMAYAILDVPSTANARYPQSRFLIFRQLPLLLASLILAGWWAVFRTVHGSEPFQPSELWPKFVAFFVASYLCGGVLALAILWFRKRKQKAASGRPTHSLWRLGTIAFAAAVAGSCVWMIATRMFLAPPVEFTLQRDCEATLIPSQQQIVIPAGTRARGSLTDNEFILKRDCEATLIPTQQNILRPEKITIPAGTHAFTAKKDLDAFELKPVPAPAEHAVNYVCFAPALLLGVLLLVNRRVTIDEDRESWGRSTASILITILGWIVFNVTVLWGAQAISPTATENQLQVFLGQPKANAFAKALLGAFVGVTGILAGLVALGNKRINTLGEKAGFQWLLIVVAAIFFVLLSVVISWGVVLTGAQPWAQEATAWLLGMHKGESAATQLFVAAVLSTGFILLFGIVIRFFFSAPKRM